MVQMCRTQRFGSGVRSRVESHDATIGSDEMKRTERLEREMFEDSINAYVFASFWTPICMRNTSLFNIIQLEVAAFEPAIDFEEHDVSACELLCTDGHVAPERLWIEVGSDKCFVPVAQHIESNIHVDDSFVRGQRRTIRRRRGRN